MDSKKIIHHTTAAALALFLLTSCGAGNGASLSDGGVHRDNSALSGGVGRETEETPIDPNAPVICIDPGHGFDDEGTTSEYLGVWDEADVNLAIAMMLDEELRSRGYATILTHNGETFPVTSAYDNNNKFKPEERTAYAETLDIDYYVSIHCNSFEDPSVNGARVYYYDGPIKTEHTSEVYAQSIVDGVLTSLEPGSKCTLVNMTSGVFHVLKATSVPASLIEVGFVTNSTDAANMIDEEWQRAFAVGIAEGIDNYYKPDESVS